MSGYGEQVSPILRRASDEPHEHLGFWCPGCDHYHGIQVNRGGQAGPAWGWNGSYDKPTFTPSILHNVGGFNERLPICHSFVTDGRIQFLSDCTHPLAGQTVDLPIFPD